MTVIIDQETCIGCGVCESIYPELYEMGVDGKAHVKNILKIDEALAKEGAMQCPVTAITVR